MAILQQYSLIELGFPSENVWWRLTRKGDMNGQAQKQGEEIQWETVHKIFHQSITKAAHELPFHTFAPQTFRHTSIQA